MTGSSIGSIVAGLNECLSCLDASQGALGRVRSLSEDLLDGCLELGIDQTAARVEGLIEDLKALAEEVDRARTRTAEIIAQVKLTNPSRAPDASARPRGRAARIELDDDAATTRGRQRENEGARVFAELGYDIEQTPAVPGRKVPDYRIEGKVFDAYSPVTNKARNIWGTIEAKVKSKQASRFVVYLDDSSVRIDDLREQFRKWPIDGLDEVLVMRARTVVRLFP